MMDNRPLITKKALIIGVAVFVIAMGGLSFAMLYNGSGQNIPDSTEPMLDFAAPGSKIAGIQALVRNGGLSRGQYSKVYAVLNSKLPEYEPDSRYFNYVEGSLSSVASEQSNVTNTVVINYSSSPVDEDEEYYEQSSDYVSERVEMEIVDTIIFAMRSESGTEYKVEVYTAGDLKTAEVKIEKK